MVALLKYTLSLVPKEEKMAGFFGDPPRLKIKLKSPSLEGKANNALVKFFKKQYELDIEILRGATSPKEDLFCSQNANVVNNLLYAKPPLCAYRKA